MSEHDIADCPKCGKRDFVLGENNRWVCLDPKCNFTEKMPRTEAGSGSNPDLVSTIIATLIALMFVLVALGL